MHMAKKSTKPEVKTETTPVEPAEAQRWMPFDGLRREIDRLFEDFHPIDWGRSIRGRALGWDLPVLRRPDWPLAPAIDVSETERAFEVKVELPGMDEKNVEVKVHNGTLTIKGEKSEEEETTEKEYYLCERRFGSFQRSFRLPEGADSDRIDAGFARGVLTVTIPKTPETLKKEKKIAIKAA
jgi:HSP20 family protein